MRVTGEREFNYTAFRQHSRSLSNLTEPLPGEKPPLLKLLTLEDRRRSLICPLFKFYVSMYTCSMCSHCQLYDATNKLVRRSAAHCVYPKKGDAESRKLTRAGMNLVAGARQKEGGMTEKLEVAIELLRKNDLDRGKFCKAMREQYNDASVAYLTTLYYQARKRIKQADAVALPVPAKVVPETRKRRVGRVRTKSLTDL